MMTLANMRNTVIAAVALAGTALPAMADFNYSDFSSVTGLSFAGVAAQNSNRILVTPSVRSVAGAVWNTSKQNVAIGFDTTMTINIENKNGGGSDGIALVIQNAAASPIGATGGGIGYGTNPAFGFAGIPNSIAIVLDMWDNNPNWPEPGNNHIAIQSRGTLQNVPDLTGTLASAATADLSDGATHSLRVNYTAGILSCYLDGALTPVLQAAVNLSTLLDLDYSGNGVGKAWIGVTASTGAAQDSQAHSLDSWCFHGNIPTPGAASLLACGGLLTLRRRR